MKKKLPLVSRSGIAQISKDLYSDMSGIQIKDIIRIKEKLLKRKRIDSNYYIK